MENPAVADQAQRDDDPLDEYSTMVYKYAKELLETDQNDGKFRWAVEKVEDYGWPKNQSMSQVLSSPLNIWTKLYDALWNEFEHHLDDGDNPESAYQNILFINQ